MAITICPICGKIPICSVTIYNANLRKQTFDILPILPTCNICGSEAEITGCTNGVKVLLLNGTCGSGKSSTAEELVKKHGFHAIDGDCVRQIQKHKLGPGHAWENNSPEMMDEISKEIDILSAMGNKIVISTVVEPQDLHKYRDIFESKGVEYRIVLLKPDYDTAVARTQTRTCHTSITPEYWVKYFYDKLELDDVEMFDNSSLTVEQSAVGILRSWRV